MTQKFLNPIFFIAIAVFLIFLLCLDRTAVAQPKDVYIIKIKGDTINPVTADYITKSIGLASARNAECLIIELDTPGGLLTSTRAIVKEILSSEIPVIVYVYPSGSRAGSAGVFITYASHIAAMAPSTNIGAAHPVELGGESRSRSIGEAIKGLIGYFSKKEKPDKTVQEGKEEREPSFMDEKILHDTIAFIKALARERNRNEEWAEKSVSMSASITEDEAMGQNVIDIIAEDEKDLLKRMDGMTVSMRGVSRTLKTKDGTIHYIDMDFRQRFLNILANPNIAYILLLLGFYGLLYEVTHPGIGFPGIAGAICIILAFFAMQTLPTNYAGLALIILAVLLFIAEANAPGLGLLTLGGIICMLLGSLILFESPYRIMRVSFMLAGSFSLATALITIFLIGSVIKSHKARIISGKEGLIGEVGRADTDIEAGTTGKIFVHGEIWNATSATAIKKGEKVKVIKVEGMELVVEKV